MRGNKVKEVDKSRENQKGIRLGSDTTWDPENGNRIPVATYLPQRTKDIRWREDRSLCRLGLYLLPRAVKPRSCRAALGEVGVDVHEPEMVLSAVPSLDIARRKFSKYFVP